MAALIRIELRKAVCNRWFAIALVIGTALAVVTALLLIVPYSLGGSQIDLLKKDYYMYPHYRSLYIYWIAVDIQTPTSQVFYRIAPLLAVLPYAASLRTELDNGYANQLFVRVPRWKSLLAKAVAAFASGGLVVVLPQVANFMLNAAFVPALTPDIGDGLYTGMGAEHLWAWFFFNVPLAYVGLYCMLNFVICGLWATFVMALSLFVKNRVVLLAAPYLALLAIQFVNERIFATVFTGVYGVQLSLMENLHAMSEPYFANGWVILAETAFLLATGALFLFLRSRRDAL